METWIVIELQEEFHGHQVRGLGNPYPVGATSQLQRDKKSTQNNRHRHPLSRSPTFAVAWMELAFPTPFQSPLSPPQPFVLSLTISPSFKSEGEGGRGSTEHKPRVCLNPLALCPRQPWELEGKSSLKPSSLSHCHPTPHWGHWRSRAYVSYNGVGLWGQPRLLESPDAREIPCQTELLASFCTRPLRSPPSSHQRLRGCTS